MMGDTGETRLARALDNLLANTERTYVVSLYRAIRAAGWEASPHIVFATDILRFIEEAFTRQTEGVSE